MTQEELAIKKKRDFYTIKPDAPIYKKEFGFYVLDRWVREGYLKPSDEIHNFCPTGNTEYGKYLREMFGYDAPSSYNLWGLGWTEGAFMPVFEEKILEDRGAYEVVQDFAGRAVLFFKGRRNGFMPEYLDHPVKDIKTWEENVKWRLDANWPGRKESARETALKAKKMQENGFIISQRIGGYQYLRSLMGPEGLLYAFYDDPDLIHNCMQTWLSLADEVTAEHQKEVWFDELFFSEDICYKGGSLISPDMIREFLFPYYQQLIENVKKRNGGRKLHIHVDTDGRAEDVIALYQEIGMDVMSPFEVASGCDVVKIGEKYPDLRMSGGIDKRKIAAGGDEIKRHLEDIMPALRKRGGYIPSCDHGVPEETPFENYMLYRSLMEEYCN